MVPLISLILSAISPTGYHREVVFKYTSNFTVKILSWCTVDFDLVNFYYIYIYYFLQGLGSVLLYPLLSVSISEYILLKLKVVEGCMNPGWENLPTVTNTNISRTCDRGQPQISLERGPK